MYVEQHHIGFSKAYLLQVSIERDRRRAEAVRLGKINLCRDELARRQAPSSVVRIILAVAEEHGVSPMDLVSASRSHRVVDARHDAIYRVKADRPTRSTPTIGRWFGKDHTTVLFALARHATVNNLPRLTGYSYAKKARRSAPRALKAA